MFLCAFLVLVCPISRASQLTYSMVQSPSWEANWFAASQEIPRISWNPKVHYRTHKRPPPVSILGQPNPVHIPTYHLLEIHPNIIHPSKPRSPQWSLSSFPTKTLYAPLSSPASQLFWKLITLKFVFTFIQIQLYAHVELSYYIPSALSWFSHTRILCFSRKEECSVTDMYIATGELII